MTSVSSGASRILFAMAVFLGSATHSFAQADDYEYAPVPLDEPLELQRGTFSPITAGGLYLTDKDACYLATTSWGWEQSSCGAIDRMIITPNASVDTLVIEAPNSDGFVTFDDWEQQDRESEIQTIWDSLETQIAEQALAVNSTIVLDDWLVHPTLDQENQYLFYATQMTWDEERLINIKATVFDRRGYVSFLIIPVDSTMPADAIKSVIEEILAAYIPSENEAYTDFSDGDKVATAGVLGVLAAVVGVKYGKVLAAGLIAVLIAFAKKLWFLLLLPIIAVFRKIFSKKE